MTVDDFLSKILDEYGKLILSEDKARNVARTVMAEYALACLHDTELAKEAMRICEKR